MSYIPRASVSCPEHMGPRVDIPIIRFEVHKHTLYAFTPADFGEIPYGVDTLDRIVVHREDRLKLLIVDACNRGDIRKWSTLRMDYLIVHPETFASIVMSLGSKYSDMAFDVVREYLHREIELRFKALTQ